MANFYEYDELEKKVAAYARVSTDSENQANSFKNQSDYFENAVRQDRNLEFTKLYSDQGLSGVYWKKRDGFNKMLKDAGLDVVKQFDHRTKKEETSYYVSKRKPKFGQIWIKNSSRFARNTFSFEIILLLRKKGVYVRFLTQNIYTKDPSQDFVLKMMMNMDENESRIKSEAVRWGYKRGLEHGNIYTHPTITGYHYDKETNTLTKNEFAPVVKKIFDLYTEEGLGIRKIIDRLEQEGIKAPKGGKRWGHTSIRNILKNEKYYGVNNGLKYDHGGFGEITWAHEKSEYELYETDKIEPIITKEQFEKATKIRSQKCETLNNQTKGRKMSYSRYAKKIVCGECGNFYIRNSDWKDDNKTKKYHFYLCGHKKRRGTKFCQSPNILESELDEIVKKFSYGTINKELEIRQANYQYLILKICEFELEEMDESKSDEALSIKSEIDKKKEVVLRQFQKLVESPELDKFGIIQESINKTNNEIEELQIKYDNLVKYNKKILDKIFLLLDEYKKIRDMKLTFKQRYSEEEILSMIDTIYIYPPLSENVRCEKMITFMIYRESKELLKEYETKYNFKVQNLEGGKEEHIKDVKIHINTSYQNLKMKLVGVYEL